MKTIKGWRRETKDSCADQHAVRLKNYSNFSIAEGTLYAVRVRWWPHYGGWCLCVSTFLCSVAFPQVNEETKLFPVFYFFGLTKAPYLNSKVKHQLINYKKWGPKYTALLEPACHEVTAFLRHTRSIYIEIAFSASSKLISRKRFTCRWLRHPTFDWFSLPIQHSNKGQLLLF